MNIKSFIIAGIVLYLLDMVYISNITGKYNDMITNIQGSEMKTKILPAVICYFFLIFGVYYFIIKNKKKPLDAFYLGVVIYGVYNATAYALIDKWSKEIAIMDTLWGGVLFYLTTVICQKIFKLNK